MTKIPIKKGQVWKDKKSSMQVEVIAKKGFHWQTRILTKKRNVYAGTHTMTPYTLWTNYDLLS